ncbi:MAG: exonuclease subunit SbcD [Aliivibrio sp.]|uniref:exonuclease subunit SbcD n=1 Tax=Aliivibrio sp. TaxID=1872443 RepID=UPI001A5650F4|nr:exonuclease subunit SbcD [Aliivibrio sp.]
MRILHTSDWHLGQFFITKSRAAEHQAFIQWLLIQIQELKIDAVIIAGDLFDTGSPPSYAREIYNQFVVEMNRIGCQLILLGGNHDSVSTLDESKQLLAYLNTVVISKVQDNLTDQIVILNNQQKQPAAIVCAIPFIRPRDVITSQSDASAQDKKMALSDAIADHYQQLHILAKNRAEEIELQYGYKVPIIATGHLTAMGVKSSESVRDIYIGTLEALPASAFPPADYIALGHIHRPQLVASSEHIRYCGSPIPLSFDELSNQKQVLLVEFTQGKLSHVDPISVPMFQPMQYIKGDLALIKSTIDQQDWSVSDLPTWLCIEVETQDYLHDLQQRVQNFCEGLNVEILQLKRARNSKTNQISRDNSEALEELQPGDVFERRLSTECFDTDEEKLRLQRIKQTFSHIVEEIKQQ